MHHPWESLPIAKYAALLRDENSATRENTAVAMLREWQEHKQVAVTRVISAPDPRNRQDAVDDGRVTSQEVVEPIRKFRDDVQALAKRFQVT